MDLVVVCQRGGATYCGYLDPEYSDPPKYVRLHGPFVWAEHWDQQGRSAVRVPASCVEVPPYLDLYGGEDGLAWVRPAGDTTRELYEKGVADAEKVFVADRSPLAPGTPENVEKAKRLSAIAGNGHARG